MGRHCHRRRYWTYNSTDDGRFLPDQRKPPSYYVLLLYYYATYVYIYNYTVQKKPVGSFKKKTNYTRDKSSASVLFIFCRVKETQIFLCRMSVKRCLYCLYYIPLFHADDPRRNDFGGEGHVTLYLHAKFTP